MLEPSLINLMNTVFLFGIAVIGYMSLVLAKETKSNSIEALEVARKTEINTNSMKDALVEAIKRSSFAEGKETGKTEGKIEGVIQGKLEAQVVAGKTL